MCIQAIFLLCLKQFPVELFLFLFPNPLLFMRRRNCRTYWLGTCRRILGIILNSINRIYNITLLQYIGKTFYSFLIQFPSINPGTESEITGIQYNIQHAAKKLPVYRKYKYVKYKYKYKYIRHSTCLWQTSRSTRYNVSANYHKPRLSTTAYLLPNANYINNIFKPEID